MMLSLFLINWQVIIIQKELMNIFGKDELQQALKLLQAFNSQHFQKIIQHSWNNKSSNSTPHRFHIQLMKIKTAQEQMEKRLKISKQQLQKRYFEYLQKKEKERNISQKSQHLSIKKQVINYRELLYTLNLTNFGEDDDFAKKSVKIYVQEQKKLYELFKAIHHSVKLGLYQPIQNFRQISQIFSTDQVKILQQFTNLLISPSDQSQQKKLPLHQLLDALHEQDLEKYKKRISNEPTLTKKKMLEIWEKLNQLRTINESLNTITQETSFQDLKKVLKSSTCSLPDKSVENLLFISQKVSSMKKMQDKFKNELHIEISGHHFENEKILLDALDYIKWSQELLVDTQAFLPIKNRIAQKQDCFFVLWYKIASLVHYCTKKDRGSKHIFEMINEQDGINVVYQEQCSVLKDQIRRLHSKMEKLPSQIQNRSPVKVNKEQKDYEKLYHSQLLELDELKQQKTKNIAFIAQNNRQLQKLKSEIKKLRDEVSSLQHRLEIMKKQKDDTKFQKCREEELLKKKLSNIQDQLSILKEEKVKDKQKIEDLCKEISYKKEQMIKKEKELESQRASNLAKTQQISFALEKQNEKLKQQNGQLQNHMSSLKEQIEKQKCQIVSEVQSHHLCGGHLFSSFSTKNQYPPVFEDNLQINTSLKLKIIDRIQDLCQKRVLETQLVYSFPQFKKIDMNFHTFFDQIHNLLLLIKLEKSNQIIGAFTQAPYQKKETQNQQKQGILFNLNRDKFFYRKKDNKLSKIAVYNEYYIVCGNSQLRIKNGQKVVYSNMGIPNKFFDTGSEKLEDFWGSSSNELEIGSYQLHRIMFKPEKI